MEEIRVYHSYWSSIFLILGSILFVFLGVWMLRRGEHLLIAWLSIVFFGLCGLAIIKMVLKEWISGRPYLLISDKKVIVNGYPSFEIKFEDVASFYLWKQRSVTFVSVRYKKGVMVRKLKESNLFARIILKMNTSLTASPEAISAVAITMPAQQLCDLLNERLQSFSSGKQ